MKNISLTFIALATLVVLGLLGCDPVATANSSGPSATSNSRNFKVDTSGIGTKPGHVGHGTPLTPAPGHELAAFSGGCFWGTERGFRHVKGVVATAVGYTGGHTENPTYDEVCTHTTGHAETVLVEFDPKVVSYKSLLEEFWNMHDPTTLDQQGPDIGDSYRSAIWTFSPEQDKEARESMAADQKHESAPIVTEIHPIGKFWEAEDYHQQYDEKTGTNTCPMPRHRIE